MKLKNALLAGAVIAGMGMAAAIGYQQREIARQQNTISALEKRVESLSFSQEIGNGHDYVILGDDVNADALKSLLADYESGMNRAFISLTARTGIEKKALTAASDVLGETGTVKGTSVKGPVKIFFRTWEALGGVGKPPVTPPGYERIASAAYGGKPYMVDLGINIAKKVSDITLPDTMDKAMKPDKFEYGTTYIAPKSERN